MVAASPRAPFAYVFFHGPTAATPPAQYEAALGAFHRALAADPPSGFVASASYRVARRPFGGEPAPGALYEDWYLVDGWSSLEALDAAAVDPMRRPAHDRAAGAATGGVGAIYAHLEGSLDLATPRFARWTPKPRGMAAADHLAELRGSCGVEASFWRRRMALGPAPEFVGRSVARPAAPDPGSAVIELRPVARPTG